MRKWLNKSYEPPIRDKIDKLITYQTFTHGNIYMGKVLGCKMYISRSGEHLLLDLKLTALNEEEEYEILSDLVLLQSHRDNQFIKEICAQNTEILKRYYNFNFPETNVEYYEHGRKTNITENIFFKVVYVERRLQMKIVAPPMLEEEC